MRLLHLALLAVTFALPAAARAQQDLGDFDSAALMGEVQDVLVRTPDAQIDGLFHALHGSMRQPQEAEAICGLFDADADRGIDALNDVATRLSGASRQRFVDSIANVIVAGLQGQPQAYDQAAAAQALKSNGARAAMLHDGFSAGLSTGAPRDARCRSLGQMLDVLADRPQPERAMVTRLLLDQGLRQIPLQ
jgi:hypothetical protein